MRQTWGGPSSGEAAQGAATAGVVHSGDLLMRRMETIEFRMRVLLASAGTAAAAAVAAAAGVASSVGALTGLVAVHRLLGRRIM